MRAVVVRITLAAAALCGGWQAPAAQAAPAGALSREAARDALDPPDAAQRMAAVERLAESGTIDDADADADPRVRAAAQAAIWQIWSRSGDPALDALLARGDEQLHAASLSDALATFDEVLARIPRHFGALAGAGQIHLRHGRVRQALDFLRRAVDVNPGLDGPAKMIPLLEKHLLELEKNQT